MQRQRLRDYLTPSFADALWVKAENGFDTVPLLGENVFIQNAAKWPDISFNRIFKTAVKSYLLNNKMRLKFMNVGGAKEVADAAFARSRPGEAGYGDYERMERTDLLLIYLAGDPKNDQYSTLLTSLVKHRVFAGRSTWVATSYSLMPDDGALDRLYGREFTNYVKPRQQRDPEGVGGGNFKLLDLKPIVDAFRKAAA